MKFVHILIAFILLSNVAQANTEEAFYVNFCDSTLRLDYIFSGNQENQCISVDELCIMPHWYGKRQRMADLPVQGNGQLTVRNHKNGEVIYRNSFSTLFQEWLSYDEAKTNTKAFENVFLMPFPKDTVDVTVELHDNRQNVTASLTHQVIPSDILIRHLGFKQTTPYETLFSAKNPNRCIHIAFIAEGYKKSEMNIFLDDARTACEALFNHEPFKSMQDKFNVIAVKSPSEESGTSEPAKGIWRNTALNSNFDTFYSDRYLTTLKLKRLHDWLAGTPYEHIIVLVNTQEYGGGGILNSYNLSMTHHKAFKPVVVHEFGHSFAGLGDEYAYENEAIPMYPHDVEPWEPNLTTLCNFHGKWEDLINKNTPIPTPSSSVEKDQVGVFEGAGYSIKGVYRPMQDCRMRTNTNPEFCVVCRRAITDLIKFYTE